jgi:choline-sulfatase
LVNQAVAYLQRHHRENQDTETRGRGDAASGKPFCLLVSLDRPHPPNVIPADYAGLYDPRDVPLPPAVPPGFHEDDPHVRRQIEQRGWGLMDEHELRTSIARYLTNVSYVDDCLGKVLAALDDLGYAENTLVVLLSDHGELLGERRQTGHGGGYTKYSLYDSAVRVPLIVRWPGVSQPGLVSQAAVELIDLMPTWLDAAGVEAPPYLPGRTLRPLLAGQAPEQVGWRAATLSEQFTPATEGAGGPRGQWTIREARYKLIHRTGARSAFYDLQEDPNEFHNLIDDPALAPARERLYAHLAQGVIARAEQFPAMWAPVVEIARPPAAPG